MMYLSSKWSSASRSPPRAHALSSLSASKRRPGALCHRAGASFDLSVGWLCPLGVAARHLGDRRIALLDYFSQPPRALQTRCSYRHAQHRPVKPEAPHGVACCRNCRNPASLGPRQRNRSLPLHNTRAGKGQTLTRRSAFRSAHLGCIAQTSTGSDQVAHRHAVSNGYSPGTLARPFIRTTSSGRRCWTAASDPRAAAV